MSSASIIEAATAKQQLKQTMNGTYGDMRRRLAPEPSPTDIFCISPSSPPRFFFPRAMPFYLLSLQMMRASAAIGK
jgi:hypothetical protein